MPALMIYNMSYTQTVFAQGAIDAKPRTQKLYLTLEHIFENDNIPSER
jgi:hypothetical protein